MDTPLVGERLTEERAFIKRYTEGLSSHPVEYQADYSIPLEDRPRKVPAVQVSTPTQFLWPLLGYRRCSTAAAGIKRPKPD
jgi:hypothetical protein